MPHILFRLGNGSIINISSPSQGACQAAGGNPLRRRPGRCANRDPPLGTASGSQVEPEGLVGKLVILPADPERGAGQHLTVWFMIIIKNPNFLVGALGEVSEDLHFLFDSLAEAEQ